MTTPARPTSTLRRALVWPFTVLLVSLSALIGALSFSSGSRAVDVVSTQLLDDTVSRIEQAVFLRLSTAGSRLEAAMPQGLPVAGELGSELDAVRQRLWLAATPAGASSPYVYFGNTAGQFIGLVRTAMQSAEIRLQLDPAIARQIFDQAGITGTPVLRVVEEKVYDARARPWYKAAIGTNEMVWTDVYSDFKTHELVITRAHRVNAPGQATPAGVVAVDLPLAGIQAFIAHLKTSQRGLAFVAEANGALIAASQGNYVSVTAQGLPARRDASHSDNAAIRAAWEQMKPRLASGSRVAQAPSHFSMEVEGEKYQVAFVPVHAEAGLNWVAAVVIPHSDFTGDLTGNALATALFSLLAVVATLWLGSRAVGSVVGDIHQLATAARRIGHGELDVAMPAARHSEVDELTQSLSAMQAELSTDQLTGLTSRSAMLRHMNGITQRYRAVPGTRHPSFALLFLDLNRFKAINDTLGHSAGDATLVEVAQRLRLAVRGGDIVARFGGDEFAIVLWRVTDVTVVKTVCDKIQELLRAPLEALAHREGGDAFTVGASIGVAYYPRQSEDISELIKLADGSMYAEKSKSREA